MKFGSLLVKLPDGREIEFSLNKPQILIGRTPDNDLVISHSTISRRHARIQFEADKILIEDLGSTNGTILDNNQLAPLQPTPIFPHKFVYLGEVQLLYKSPERQEEHPSANVDLPVDPVGEPGQPPEINQSVHLGLEGPFEPVAPGSTTIAKITIQNLSTSPWDCLIRVSGLPASWFSIDKDRLNVNLGEREDIVLYLHPPRLPEATSGNHHFKITIYSSKHGRGPSTYGTLNVLPFHHLDLTLEKGNNLGDFILVVTNQGNIPLDYSFHGIDPQDKLLFELDQTSLHLEVAQNAVIPLKVYPSFRPFFGQNQVRTFSVVANSTNSGLEEITTAGNLTIKPFIPFWAAPASLFFVVLMAIIGLLSYPKICAQLPISIPYCSEFAPSIQIFEADPIEIPLGAAVKIVWDVHGADSVELVVPILNLEVAVPHKGTQEFLLAQSTNFTLRAGNSSSSIEDTIWIKVIGAPPGVYSFFAEPSAIVSGQVGNVILNWSVLDTTDVIIEGVLFDILPPQGKIEISSPTTDTTYTLVAENEFGTTRKELTVFVISPGCVVSNLPGDEKLGIYAGPSTNHLLLGELDEGTLVEPFGRTIMGDWLLSNAANQHGWLQTDYINCIVGIDVFPIFPDSEIPTLPVDNAPKP